MVDYVMDAGKKLSRKTSTSKKRRNYLSKITTTRLKKAGC
jgi:hypothetical protein